MSQDEINQKIIQCAAMADGIQYLSFLVNEGFTKALSTNSETLYFIIEKKGVNALLSISFDKAKKPIITTTDSDYLMWFTRLNWEALLVYNDKIIFQGPLLSVSERESMQCFSIELPVTDLIARILSNNHSIQFGYEASSEGDITIINECPIHNLLTLKPS